LFNTGLTIWEKRDYNTKRYIFLCAFFFIVPTRMKRCTKCNEQKELSEFHKTKRAKDGYRSWCKLCVCDDAKAKRLADPTRFRGYSKKCNDKNREKRRQYGRQWYEQNRERKLAKVKQQRREDPRHFRLLSAKCYLRNIEKRKAYAKRYRQNNLERFRQWGKAYRQRHLRIDAPWRKDRDGGTYTLTEWQRRNEQQVSQRSATELLSEIEKYLNQEQIAFLDALTDANFDLHACAAMLNKNSADCVAMLLTIREIASQVKDGIG
jgi:hypothetical protein